MCIGVTATLSAFASEVLLILVSCLKQHQAGLAAAVSPPPRDDLHTAPLVMAIASLSCATGCSSLSVSTSPIWSG